MTNPPKIHIVTGKLKKSAGGTPVYFAWGTPESAQRCAEKLAGDESYAEVAGPDVYAREPQS